MPHTKSQHIVVKNSQYFSAIKVNKSFEKIYTMFLKQLGLKISLQCCQTQCNTNVMSCSEMLCCR